MMLTKILIFAWTFGIINQRTTPFIIDCLTRVQKCPIGKEAWAIKNDRYRCKGTETYVCIQDSNRNLYEGCMSNFTIQANSGNCPVLIVCEKNKPYLGLKESYFPCPEEDPGCPAKSHPEYSIQELYKYPRCSGSQLFLNTSRTRQDSTTFGFNSTKDHVQGQGHTYIIVILVVIPVIIVCSMIGCFLVYKRCKARTNENYAAVIYHRILDTESVCLRPSERLDIKGKEKELKDLILHWNEIQTERIQILPLDEDDTMEINDVYTEVFLRDESDKRYSKLDEKSNIQNTTLDKIFLLPEEKPARFIFMLGEAGYGKTVQCQQITRSWCQAWKNENCQDDLLGTLKIFDFLFFVKLRDTRKNHTSLIDIILEAYSLYHPSQECLNTIRTVLEQGKYKSLVILDGLDEWNIPDADKLLDKGIPDCRNLYECTILISMRSWKFIEVKQIRHHKLDKVVRLCGLDERGFESFREALLCRYLKMDKASEEFQTITSSIEGFMSTSSYAASSLLKIPLLAIFCILTFHQNVQSGNSLTTLYLSILETLLKRAKFEIRSTEFESVYPTLKNYKHVQIHRNDLSHLGKIAFSGLTSEALIFTSEELNETFGEHVLERYLKIGLLIKAKTRGQLHESNVNISFLHKTIQEFLAAFYVWTEGNIDENFLRKHVLDVEKALEFSMVLTFLSGLSSVDGSKISMHLKDLASTDEDIQSFRLHFASDSYEKVFHLYDLQLRCYREIRRPNNKECFNDIDELKFSFSDIILHGKDSDRQLIRDTAYVLLQHPHDIESLQMKFIPDDEQNGITNDELKNFLDKSTSIKSVNIDGYVDGECRDFTHFSEKMKQLTTLGLHNIAIEGEILTDLFTKNTKRNFEALALYYIRSSEDPNVRFEYKFPSEKSKPSPRSGYERKERIRALPTSDSHNNKDKDSGEPLLKDILRVLPDFELLTTLHISYMESLEDRNILLVVAKELQTKGKLKNFGYRGSSIYNVADDQHDTEIIEVILTMNQLEYIFLCDIALNDKFPVFPEMLQLKKFSLQDISMNKMEWRKLVTALSVLSNKACLANVVLTDTDIDDESLKQFEVAPDLSIKNDIYMI